MSKGPVASNNVVSSNGGKCSKDDGKVDNNSNNDGTDIN